MNCIVKTLFCTVKDSLIFLLGLYFLAACTTAPNDVLNATLLGCDFTGKAIYTLEPSQKPLFVRVSPNSFPEFTQTQIRQNRYLYGYKNGSYQLEIFDLLEAKHLHTTFIDKNIISNLGSFWVHNLDSIFFAQEPTQIVLLNRNGQLVNKWNLNLPNMGWKLPKDETNQTPLVFFFNHGYSIAGFDQASQNIYLSFASPDLWYFSERTQGKLCATYNLKTNKCLATYGQLPSSYLTDNQGFYPFSLCVPNLCVHQDIAVVSYPMSHKIQVYDNRTGKLLADPCISSTNLTELNPLMNSSQDIQAERNFINSSGYYGHIYFHPAVQLFSRVVVLPQPLKNKDGTLNTLKNKEVSVILFDSKFKIVGEFLFDKKSMYSRPGTKNHVADAIATDNGFWGTRQADSQIGDDTLAISTFFKIKPIR